MASEVSDASVIVKHLPVEEKSWDEDLLSLPLFSHRFDVYFCFILFQTEKGKNITFFAII